MKRISTPRPGNAKGPRGLPSLGRPRGPEKRTRTGGSDAQQAVQRLDDRRLRLDADLPGSEAFALLRSAEFPVAIGYPLDALPATRAEVARDARYRLDGPVQVELLRRSLAALEPAERVDFEALAVVRLTARVLGPSASSATLRVERPA